MGLIIDSEFFMCQYGLPGCKSFFLFGIVIINLHDGVVVVALGVDLAVVTENICLIIYMYS